MQLTRFIYVIMMRSLNMETGTRNAIRVQMYNKNTKTQPCCVRIENLSIFTCNLYKQSMKELESILKDYGLRNTHFRHKLLRIFHDSESSLDVEEIKKLIEIDCNKATIYRALDAFEKCDLIHRVPDKNNLVRYALCRSGKGSNNHAHLICSSCNKTFCLDEIEVPKIENVDGFEINDTALTLEGICQKCQIKTVKDAHADGFSIDFVPRNQYL